MLLTSSQVGHYRNDVDEEHYFELVPPLERVLEIEEWTQTILGVGTKDAMWEMQMGNLLNNLSYSLDAERRYRHALELDPINWRARYTLATMLESSAEAIALLKSEVERCESDENWLRDNKVAFADILFELGRRYWERQQQDLAVQIYRRSIEVDVTGYERALEIMEQYESEQRWPDIRDVLKIIQNGS
ncbi:hypothetical protein PHISCL_09767 [Aspergillus sclerotialis]|uniref:Tetratricopeptide repeat protein n=1 Tax=Aspergillus sclerotialis TaxID=2070753 RepID=A0A3A2Z9D6_9EURO|nr:hypothetical protein PHISCL_09767 [Aspergillus sclerotialis]